MIDVDINQVISFVEEHYNENVTTLRLKYTLAWQRFAIAQIEARHKCVDKLPSYISHKQFLFPSTVVAEQATNEIVAKFHASLFKGCDKIVDFTAGLCIDAIEIAKYCHVDAIEIDSHYFEINKINVDRLAANVSLHNQDSLKWAIDMPCVDAAFIDPARRDNSHNRVYNLDDCSPNIFELLPLIKDKMRYIIVKASPILNINDIAKQIPNISDFWIVSHRNECKELLFKIVFNHTIEQQYIHAINFTTDGCQELSCKNTPDTTSRYGNPAVGGYLYEPNSSVMKLMLFDSLYNKYESIEKIAPNSHLFCANELYSNFPGRIFHIDDIITYKKGKLSSPLDKANVATRNFPITAHELSKKLKIKDGGDCYIFGTTTSTRQAVLIVCSKIIS